MSKREPQVDILIPTIGRRSLRTALLAAASQTHRGVRVVVCADGPQPEAEAIVREVAASRTVYRQTPERFGHGDFVKEWWINHKDAAPWLRVLDDDDWMPPYAIAEMMREAVEGVSLVVCQMVVCVAGNVGSPMRWRVSGGELTEDGATTGTCLMRTAAIRGPYPVRLPADYRLACRAAAVGEVRFVQTPLYWYNGYRGGKALAKRPRTGYPEKYRYRFPHAFRKALLVRVPLENFMDDAGRLFRRAEDQAMFRAMARLAKRTARISVGHYRYEVATNDWTPAAEETARTRKLIVSRGFIPEGARLKSIAACYDEPEICFLVPCYRAEDKIARCIRSIQRQAGEWRCIIAVDGHDTKTADATYEAVGRDGRFTVIFRQKRLYGLGNQLEAVKDLPDNTIVCQVDGDDYLLGDAYALAVAEAFADPDVEMTYGCGLNVAKSAEERRLQGQLAKMSDERSALVDEHRAKPTASRKAEIASTLTETRPQLIAVRKALEALK